MNPSVHPFFFVCPHVRKCHSVSSFSFYDILIYTTKTRYPHRLSIFGLAWYPSKCDNGYFVLQDFYFFLNFPGQHLIVGIIQHPAESIFQNFPLKILCDEKLSGKLFSSSLFATFFQSSFNYTFQVFNLTPKK